MDYRLRTVLMGAVICSPVLALMIVPFALAQRDGRPAYVDVADDPHMAVVPRTADEAARIAAVVAPTDAFDAPEPFEQRPGGAATSFATLNENAFSQPSANIDFERRLDFFVGNGFFRKLWVSSPASTLASDGLGPLYNARSCQRCHLKDGRGHPPASEYDNAVSMVLRLAVPATLAEASGPEATIDGHRPTVPDPVYGGQLQDFSVAGVPAEYRLRVRYEEVEVALSDGEVVTLRRPIYETRDLAYGPLHADAVLSPRVAQQMIGLGLLEAVPAADILANADPDDLDGDGISGRPNIVWSHEFGRPMLGRFGHKAGQPTIREQSASAFIGDIGVSTSLRPDPTGDCTPAQTACVEAPQGAPDAHAPFEISDEALDFVTFYSRNLAPPARRDLEDPMVLRGKEVFYSVGCASCHTPKFVTHRLADQPEQSFQLIWPYTDLLLHDMGEGLADGMPEGLASGREWRTAPLWGVGLTETVNGHMQLLHDGRARSVLEAILWHGGEAEAARRAVVEMPKPDRDALIRFVESL